MIVFTIPDVEEVLVKFDLSHPDFDFISLAETLGLMTKTEAKLQRYLGKYVSVYSRYVSAVAPLQYAEIDRTGYYMVEIRTLEPFSFTCIKFRADEITIDDTNPAHIQIKIKE